MASSYKNLSNEDLLFEKYLIEVRTRSIQSQLDNKPSEHFVINKVMFDILSEEENNLKTVNAEIERRKLSDRDLWTGEKLSTQQNNETSEGG
ncbi:MAG: hypothetical protein MJZ34_02350 [Paludibacteraceae bacterium]|nr:hypothetical protein [Paludibacteraceae bacterium]